MGLLGYWVLFSFLFPQAFPLLLGGISTLCTTDPSDSESLLALLLAVSGFLVDDCTGKDNFFADFLASK